MKGIQGKYEVAHTGVVLGSPDLSMHPTGLSRVEIATRLGFVGRFVMQRSLRSRAAAQLNRLGTFAISVELGNTDG